MALITCIECGQEFSDKAKACPSCGLDSFFSTFHFMSMEFFNAVVDEAWRLREIRLQCYREELTLSRPFQDQLTQNASALDALNRRIAEKNQELVQLKGKLFTGKKQAQVQAEIAEAEEKVAALESENKNLKKQQAEKIAQYRATAPSEWTTYDKIDRAERTGLVVELTESRHRGNYLRYYVDKELKEYLSVAKSADLAELRQNAPLLEEMTDKALELQGFRITTTDGKQTITIAEKPKMSKIDQEIEQIRASIASLRPEIGIGMPVKKASVIGRALVGGAIAGPVGAIVGALSAVDQNNR